MGKEGKIKIKLTTAIILSLILIAVIVAIIVGIVNSKIKPYNDKEVQMQAEDMDFSLKFLKLENNKQNMVYSPLSIKYALKMLNEGAQGNTKLQIENVVGNLNLTKYNNIDKVLSLANGVYIRDTYAGYVKEDFKNILTQKYNAEIKTDTFANANNINNWIENKTLGIIKKMLTDEQIQNKELEMVLINALAIDMEWETTFKTDATSGEKFYLENGSTMTATMMHAEVSNDNIAYYQDEDITALTMQLKEYEDTQMEFIAIMPENNLSKYVETFTMEELNKIINESTLTSKEKAGVKVTIPKFSFDYNLNLKQDLINLGITDAFSEQLADFSNMSEKPLYVNDALHKANIEFSEEGIKAAAVTTIFMADITSIGPINQPKEIKIDKPFLYFIRDKKTGEIWFVGTVYEPNSWENDMADYR